MLYLRAFVPAGILDETTQTLRRPDVRHVVLSGTTVDGASELITAEVEPEAADDVLAVLVSLGLEPGEISLSRVEIARPVGPEGPAPPAVDRSDALVWAEVADEAVENVGLRASYLAYMAVAGVIAAFGVIEHSAILIVGAMAVSPDLLPLTAAAVAIVGLRPRLFGRALGTLVPGLATGVVAGLLTTLALRAIGYVSPDLAIDDGVVAGLAHVAVPTVGVALAAGVAGMLSFQTRSNFAVGVAISVTTIPAAAYMGVAAGLGQWRGALGALAVLAVNLAMLLLAGTITLSAQRAVERRRRAAI